MSKYLTVGGVVVAFLAGYWFAAQGYSEDIADMQKAYAESARVAQEKYDAELVKVTARLSEIVAERDEKIAQLAAADRERSDLTSRMQQLAAGGGDSAGADSDPCLMVRADLRGCLGLLAEGSKLRQEGSRLLGECSKNLEAIKQLQ